LTGWEEAGFEIIRAIGERGPQARAIAQEMPVAIEINGFGYAVLMATGDALADLAYGFALSERLIDRAGQILATQVHQTDDGAILRIELAADCVERIHDRVRHRTSESSCGLCGLENLEQAMRPLPRAERAAEIAPEAVFAASPPCAITSRLIR
jgi:FdhD protein